MMWIISKRYELCFVYEALIIGGVFCRSCMFCPFFHILQKLLVKDGCKLAVLFSQLDFQIEVCV